MNMILINVERDSQVGWAEQREAQHQADWKMLGFASLSANLRN